MKKVTEYDKFKQIAKPYEKVFDIVRLIDPIKKNTIGFEEYKAIPQNTKCYSIWRSGEICHNCISKKALEENDVLIKIQDNAGRMFLIFALPIKINEKILVMELLKDITNNIVFETVGRDKGIEETNIINDLSSLLLKDPTTNLYNRRYINQMLPVEAARSIENESSLSISMVDIDYFKDINDTYGHYVGDIIINKFGQMLTESIRNDTDWVARYGGDEFLICLNNTDSKEAIEIVERIRKEIERAVIIIENKTIQVTASFGLCVLKNTDLSAVDLIKCADDKLYEAKKQGRNKVIF